MTKFKGRYRIESTRLRGWDYANAGMYFVTICTKDHIPFFGHVVEADVILSPIGQIVADEWQKTPQIRSSVLLDEWIIMPNHLHGIIIIVDTPCVEETPGRGETSHRGVSTIAATTTDVRPQLQSGSLGAIVGQVKSTCTKRIWAAGFTDFAWQPRFYDRVIRGESSLKRIRRYIADNPARWEEDRYNPSNLLI